MQLVGILVVREMNRLINFDQNLLFELLCYVKSYVSSLKCYKF